MQIEYAVILVIFIMLLGAVSTIAMVLLMRAVDAVSEVLARLAGRSFVPHFMRVLLHGLCFLSVVVGAVLAIKSIPSDCQPNTAAAQVSKR